MAYKFKGNFLYITINKFLLVVFFIYFINKSDLLYFFITDGHFLISVNYLFITEAKKEKYVLASEVTKIARTRCRAAPEPPRRVRLRGLMTTAHRAAAALTCGLPCRTSILDSGGSSQHISGITSERNLNFNKKLR